MSTKQRVTIAGICLVAVLGAGIATWTIVDRPERSAAADTASTARTATAPVTEGDLTESRVFSGTLGYGAPVGVPGAAQGTITALPTPGQVIHRDEQLYAVDERPVRAMHGTVPLWRTLEYGLRGADIAQLNSNLAALRYDVVEDDSFGAKTLAAVRQWQEDRGLAVTGRLDADDIAFVDGDVRVANVTGVLGQAPGGDLIEVTSTKRVVTASVAQQDADALSVGTEVAVRVNGTGDPLTGTVVDAVRSEAQDGATPKVDVTIAIEVGDRELPTAATAQVTVSGQTEEGVLSVPVSALVAGRAEGGFAVDKVVGGTKERVSVKVGFVADGRAAVTGDLRAGDEVVVPS